MIHAEKSDLAAIASRLRRDCALFLDIDGTLIDIAPTPQEVVVPPSLPALLERTAAWLGGAMAVVSGRPLAMIDTLLAPTSFPYAGEHGAILRLRDGTLEKASTDQARLRSWRLRIVHAARNWPGVVVETEKEFGIGVHFRQAPQFQGEILALVAALVAEDDARFEVLPASMAYEIRDRAVNKGEPVKRLMATPPFAGRIPVFVGDDITDRDGYRAAESLGGIGLDVNAVFDGQSAHVRRWLLASLTL